jgi:hypothetical protein
VRTPEIVDQYRYTMGGTKTRRYILGRRSNYDKVGRTPQIINEKFDDFKHKTFCHLKFIMENVFY